MTTRSLTPRTAQRQALFLERHTEAEAQLQYTLELVTAMFWNLEAGDSLTDEQVAAARHDRVLGILWCRIWDYAEYCSRRRRIHRIAHDDETSEFVAQDVRRCSAELDAFLRGERPASVWHDELKAAGLKLTPRARAYRRRCLTLATKETHA